MPPKLKVLLVGPYPPPYGGLAVQLCEWQRHLARLGSYECAILNIGESRTADIAGCIPVRGAWDFARKVYRFAKQGHLIHLMTNGHNIKSWLCSFVCALAGAGHGRRTVLVFGSGHGPDYIANAGPMARLLIRATVMLGGRLICRNERMRQGLLSVGAEAHKIAIVPGFWGGAEVTPGPVPEDLQTFLETHQPVFGATATNLDPEYGIPLLLHGLERLRKTYPHAGLVLIGIYPGGAPRARLGGLERVRQHVYFTGPLPHDVALSVMQRLTIFVRPTYFDGDSNSVREALALGVPVVASNTDYRPPGIIQFRKGDVSDLAEKVRYALEHLDALKRAPRTEATSVSADRLVGLYRELAGGAES